MTWLFIVCVVLHYLIGGETIVGRGVFFVAVPCKGISFRARPCPWVGAPPSKFHENANLRFPLFFEVPLQICRCAVLQFVDTQSFGDFSADRDDPNQ